MLLVDDERPALDELGYLLAPRPARRRGAHRDSATEALRILRESDVDAVFLDIQMPGLTGLELAQVLARFRTPPPVVFVTAHEEHAVEAFELDAVDYVLKPVREERLAEAVRRVVEHRRPAAARRQPDPRRARRGDPVRRPRRHHLRRGARRLRPPAHAGGAHLVRIPLSTLEEEWAPAGFVRIHRSLLVALAHIDEVRMDAGRCTVVVAGAGAGR